MAPEYVLGQLRELLTLQRRASTEDTVGGRTVETWSTVAVIWGLVEALRANERIATAGIAGVNAFRVVTRYRTDVIPSEMRLLRPVKPLTVVSITRVGTTATATLAEAHYLKTGAVVRLEGAGEAAYNLTTEITVPDGATPTFTYEVSGAPTSPATGTIYATHVEILEIAGAPRTTADRLFIKIESQQRAG